MKRNPSSVSPALPATTLETVRFPVSGSGGVTSLVFVNTAVDVPSFAIVPVSPVLVVT